MCVLGLSDSKAKKGGEQTECYLAASVCLVPMTKPHKEVVGCFRNSRMPSLVLFPTCFERKVWPFSFQNISTHSEVVLVTCFPVVGIKFKALWMVGKSCTTELCPQAFWQFMC